MSDSIYFTCPCCDSVYKTEVFPDGEKALKIVMSKDEKEVGTVAVLIPEKNLITASFTA